MTRYGMMVSLAIGDAYGFSFEFAPSEFVAKYNYPELGYVQHHKYPKIKPGSYSDDTQMSMGLAEMLLSSNQRTNRMLWTLFLNSFKRDPRTGYSEGFYKLLQGSNNWIDLATKIIPNSTKSGGAMRAASCGLLPSVSQVIDTAFWQASLTHATQEGMTSAAAAALLVWACRQGCTPSYLPSFLKDVLPGVPWQEPWVGPVDSSGYAAVRAAVTALETGESMTKLLQTCVGFTGDVDTVATICLAAASLHPDLEQDLPKELYDGLEKNGTYGKKYLEDLDNRLLNAFPQP